MAHESGTATIGDRVAALRRAHPMTQEELAERSGVSVETIRKLEQNANDSPRMKTLHKLAAALSVATTELIGDASEAAVRSGPDSDELGLVAVRRVLTPVRGLRGTVIGSATQSPAAYPAGRSAIARVDRLYHDDAYAETLRALPGLILDAQVLVETAAEGEQREAAYALLATAYRIAGKTLLQLRHLDLAHTALTAALSAADRSSDPAGLGAAVIRTMCWLMLRQNRFGDAESLAIATADEIEPRFSKATPEELATWGWLLLYASGAAARDNRVQHATELLDNAAAAAARMGERGIPVGVDAEMAGFCTAKVQMSRVEALTVAGDAGQALVQAERVERSTVPTPSCRNRHRLDVSWALLEQGRDQQARDVLLDLGHRAPTWMRQQRYARDLVSKYAAGRRRAMNEEMAQLAGLLGSEI